MKEIATIINSFILFFSILGLCITVLLAFARMSYPYIALICLTTLLFSFINLYALSE